MDDPKIKYLKAKVEECLAKENFLPAVDYYTQLYDHISVHSPSQKADLPIITDKIVKLLNATAMKFIQQERYEDSWSALKKAESFAATNSYLKVSTYNNMACLYRKLNRPKSALVFLEQALVIEYKHLTKAQTDANFELALVKENPSDTHLNLCAVLSAIGKHEVAYLHALKALTFLQAEVFERTQGSFDEAKFELRPLKSRCAVLCIAYHNLATELEFMKQTEDALDAYMKAAGFAEKYLGPLSSLTKNMRETAKNVKEALEKEKQKRLERQIKSSHRLIRTRSMANNAQLTAERWLTNSASKKKSQQLKALQERNGVRVIVRTGRRDWLGNITAALPKAFP